MFSKIPTPRTAPLLDLVINENQAAAVTDTPHHHANTTWHAGGGLWCRCQIAGGEWLHRRALVSAKCQRSLL